MSVDERSPKRQRRSFSPPSPAAKLAFVAADHPHTPPPSVHMSPTWNAQSSSLQNGGGVTFPTPPSTSGYHGHMTGRGPSSDGGVESGTGTPTEAGEARKDGDGDVNMGSEGNAEHRRSDHERSSDAKQPAALPLFKLVTKPIARQRPHPYQDMLGLYGLRGIQASVQRVDPVTGQKVNKLRKSYEGKLKELRLDGRNKATESPKELEGLVDPGWDYITPNGNTLWQEQMPGADTEGPLINDMLANLDAALSFKPGKLPKDEYNKWNYQLGLNVPSTKATGNTNSATPQDRKNATSNFLKANTGPLASKSAPSSPANARPDRAGKKRPGSWVDYGDSGAEDSGKRRRRD